MRTIGRFGALGLVIATVIGAWWLRATGATAAVSIRANVEVVGATPGQVEMVRWAVGRFRVAALEPPEVEIAFHGDPSGCGGHLGFAKGGAVDVCSALVNAMARRALLHEMSHVWLDQHVDDETKARFLVLRDLPSWNVSSDPWRLRGYEQGAEIISRAIGERILTPQILYEELGELDLAFRLLTGVDAPTT
jgi:hypothetical protein